MDRSFQKRIRIRVSRGSGATSVIVCVYCWFHATLRDCMPCQVPCRLHSLPMHVLSAKFGTTCHKWKRINGLLNPLPSTILSQVGYTYGIWWHTIYLGQELHNGLLCASFGHQYLAMPVNQSRQHRPLPLSGGTLLHRSWFQSASVLADWRYPTRSVTLGICP